MNIHPNCWNEYEELKTVVVCSPSILDVPDQQTATDVQWEKAVKQKKARDSHEEMVRTMEEAGVNVIDYSVHLSQEDIKLNEQLINRIFVRDLACVFGQEYFSWGSWNVYAATRILSIHTVISTVV